MFYAGIFNLLRNNSVDYCHIKNRNHVIWDTYCSGCFCLSHQSEILALSEATPRMVDDTCNRETEGKRNMGSETEERDRRERGWEEKGRERDVHNDSESPQK